jgi:pimeloyl-ACP methyl ester carboxylesterase
MATKAKRRPKKNPPLVIAEQGHFFLGGEYHPGPRGGKLMAGQAYVEYQIPAKLTQPYPIVFIHGGGQTGTNFTCKPDGKEGWAQFFLRRGYATYVMDQPGRGRSGYDMDVYGPFHRHTPERLSERFTNPRRTNLYPQAKLHSQWPGTGEAGDRFYDRFYASQFMSMDNPIKLQEMMRAVGSELLARIGPAIVLTHSQSGVFGWIIADANPKKVKAIIAVEPGLAVAEVEGCGPPDWFRYQSGVKSWGISTIPMAYDPPAKDPSEMRFVQEDKPQGPNLARVWRQAEPARKLVNMKGLPVAVVTGEGSYHAPWEHGTVQYLCQAGVKAEHIKLQDYGVRGNGHMMMLEKNSDEVAAVMHGWLAKTLKPRKRGRRTGK